MAGQSPAVDSDAVLRGSLLLPDGYNGPPAPTPPAVISRDESGRATVRAVRLDQPLRVDGSLDEPFYENVQPISGFIQSAPVEGAPATEVTEVWLSFDRDNVYVSARCWESDPSRIVASEMRRDNTTVFAGSDAVGFLLDTFYDRRNGVLFTVNAIGGLADGQVTNEAVYNANWNPIWDAKVSRFDRGWSFEAVIPFKSLRYQPGTAQVWGFSVRRVNRAKNEESFLTRIPIAKVTQGVLQSSLAATVVGLEVPSGARNLDVKPYVTSNLVTNLASMPRINDELGADFGLDVKYGISQNVTADLTYNTDFAQVEADEQQINLTRFNLFFPEKREFFLENLGLFEFGGIQANDSAGDKPILFYSRRIGLQQGRPVPIELGGRLTGRLRRYSFGVLAINTGSEATSGALPATSTVVRLKRDIFGRSSVGVLLTSRSGDGVGARSNIAFGVDGAFALSPNLMVNSYWAKTRTEGASGDDSSYRAQLDYAGDRYGLQLEQMAIDDRFNPEIGFVRRTGLRRTFGQGRFSPRLKGNSTIRRLSLVGALNYVENTAARVDTRTHEGEFAIEFHNSDRLTLAYANDYEYVPEPFRVGPGAFVPVGEYTNSTGNIAYTLGQQRRLSGTFRLEHGTFYNGHKTTWTLSRGRLNLRQLTLEPSYSLNRVELIESSFTTHLVGSRVTYTMTPRMFTSALIQFNSDADIVASNMRLRWEYRPGSELFVVYTEERDTRQPGYPELFNRSLAVKVNRLIRF